MLQNIRSLCALGKIQMQKLVEGIGFRSVFCFQYQRSPCGCCLLLSGQLRGQRSSETRSLALQDQLDARADLRAPEIGLPARSARTAAGTTPPGSAPSASSGTALRRRSGTAPAAPFLEISSSSNPVPPSVTMLRSYISITLLRCQDKNFPQAKAPGKRNAGKGAYAASFVMFMSTLAPMARVAVPFGLNAPLEPARYFSAVQ